MEANLTFFLTLAWILTPEPSPDSHGEPPRQNPHISSRERGKVTFLNMPSAFSLTKAYSPVKRILPEPYLTKAKGHFPNCSSF